MNLSSIKLLLVDDNQHMRVLLTEIVRALGAKHVFEAVDGATAMDFLRANAVDVVITDLAMQPIDGIEFVRMLRNSPTSPAPLLPVIMITGHSTQTRVCEARDVGVTEFLAKPVTVRGVLERLLEVVDNPRPFIRSETYFGPDRRRKSETGFAGPWRRANDPKPEVVD